MLHLRLNLKQRQKSGDVVLGQAGAGCVWRDGVLPGIDLCKRLPSGLD